MPEPVRVALPRDKPEPEKAKAADEHEHKHELDRCPHCGHRLYTGPGSSNEATRRWT